MAHYRHDTGRIAKSMSTIAPVLYKVDGIDEYLPSWLIETSSEWELIQDPILSFKSDDGHELLDGDVVYCLNTITFILTSSRLRANALRKTNYKYFKIEEKAKEYLHLHKPQYSKFQIALTIDKFNFAEHFKYSIVKALDEL